MMNSAAFNAGTLETPSLQILFERCGDRFRHGIRMREAPVAESSVWSCEGGLEDDWPRSPPMQSLHLELGPNGKQRAMLVGMAGRSHWSMSVEADAANDRFLFDLACRVREIPPPLRSCYEWQRQAGNGGPPILFEPVPPLEMIQTPDRIVLQVVPQNISLPATIRWQYTVLACDRNEHAR
jgi:hypothetical protein